MSASVFLSCNATARSVPRSTVTLTLDRPSAENTPDERRGGILIMNKSSLPLYAISQPDSETADQALSAD
jgi:hypothetical protein